MQEIWKDIRNYEGLYQISNFGNIRSLSFGARNVRPSNIVRNIHTSPSNCGYFKVQLYNNGKSQMKYIHRLVAEAFIPNPDNKPQVNHIDGNKSNNHVTNLEWVSCSENQRHAIKLGIHAPAPMQGRTGKLSPNSKPILQYSLDGKLLNRWDCISDAARHYKTRSSNISLCLCGYTHTALGFVWKYDKT